MVLCCFLALVEAAVVFFAGFAGVFLAGVFLPEAGLEVVLFDGVLFAGAGTRAAAGDGASPVSTGG